MNVHARQSPSAQVDNLRQSSGYTGGWLIDAQGREIAITDDMIQQACVALDQAWCDNEDTTQG
tara:strand:- start:25111 stop:25299 length:189 start_codon:yes stop_codon:yes gene_type:complete